MKLKLKNIFILICLMVSVIAESAPISREQARQKASAFVANHPAAARMRTSKPASIHLTEASEGGNGSFYIFNIGADDGFVIISGDDRTPVVLGYSDHGSIDMGNLNPGLSWLLRSYASEISSLGSETISSSQKARKASPAISEMLQTRWSQNHPYNLLCPTVNGGRALTGCVATAFAQVMYYHRYPTGQTVATAPYPDHLNNFEMRQSLPATTFDWDNMLTTYNGNETETQQLAVAKLMQYCGHSVIMAYSTEESLSATENIPNAAKSYFGYSDQVRFVNHNDYSDAEWEELIYGELAAGRPVIYSGSDSQGLGGHAFVCDGYNDGQFHINWGFIDANGNGYYRLTGLNPSGYSYQFNKDQGAVIYLKPKSAVITATNLTREYGDENPTFEYTISGGGSITGTPSLSCDARPDSPVGTYPIRISRGSISDGDATYVEGTLTVKAAPLTVTARDYTIKQGDPMPEFQVDYSGWKLSDDEKIITHQPTFNTYDINNKSFVGEYSIMPENVEAPNYEPKYVRGKLTIEAGQPYDAEIGGIFYNFDATTQTAEVTYGKETQGNYRDDVVIPQTVEYEGKTYTVTSIGKNAFNTCRSLNSVSIPATVTIIKGFSGCSNLKEIILPEALTEIGDYAFSHCSGLETIIIPARVKRIGTQAFNSCDNLSTVTVLGNVPAELGYRAFRTNSITLYVPAGSKGAYQEARYWQDFKEIIETDVAGVTPGDANGDSIVNAADIVEIINYILNNPSSKFNKKNADISGDGTVDTSDIELIVKLIIK